MKDNELNQIRKTEELRKEKVIEEEGKILKLKKVKLKFLKFWKLNKIKNLVFL